VFADTPNDGTIDLKPTRETSGKTYRTRTERVVRRVKEQYSEKKLKTHFGFSSTEKRENV
jgi:ADP-dependent phosphofructokinase/glucokinase